MNDDLESMLGEPVAIYGRSKRPLEFWVTKDREGVFFWKSEPDFDKSTGIFFGGEAMGVESEDSQAEDLPIPFMKRIRMSFEKVKGDAP